MKTKVFMVVVTNYDNEDEPLETKELRELLEGHFYYSTIKVISISDEDGN